MNDPGNKGPPGVDGDDEETAHFSRRETRIREPGERGASRAGSPQLEPGRQFGQYLLIGRLGRGGFGEVWEAEHEETGRRVALKVLTKARNARPKDLERFEREGRLAASLNHPRCVYVFSAEQIEGVPAITLELMPGGTLQDLLDKEGPLPYKRAVDYILDIIDGLEAAQEKGIIHRDIKPSNCFLDDEGRAKIGDFGLSKSLEIESKLTTSGTYLGTPAFSSPEQVRGREVDFRSDMFSLGATLYALLTGEPPFGKGHAGDVLARIVSEEPTPFNDHEVSLQRGLRRIIHRLLSKEPANRYEGYAALRYALIPFSSRRKAAPARLAERFIAFAVDSILLSGALTVTLKFLPALGAFRKETALLLMVGYFFPLEARWGQSPGKRLLGLRVVTPLGYEASYRRVIVRTLTFTALLNLEWFSQSVLLISRTSLLSPILLGAAGWLAVLSTMRTRNDDAGLHEIVSGTRIMKVESAEERVVLVGPSSVTTEGQDAKQFGEKFGSFETSGILWKKESEALLLAHDPLLKRDVWIHRYADLDRARQLGTLSSNRPTLLRWLQGARDRDYAWDAYAAPTGTSFVEWVRQRGRLSWSEGREIVLLVAQELEQRSRDRSVPLSLNLNRLWIDDAARPKLLDFSAPYTSADLRPTVETGSEPGRFLRQVILFALEGRIVDDHELDSQRPAVPLPPHAERSMIRLWNTDPENEAEDLLGEVIELLTESAELPAAVTRHRRTISLSFVLLLVVPPILLTLHGLVLGYIRNLLDITGMLFMGVFSSTYLCGLISLFTAAIFRGGAFMDMAEIAVRTQHGEIPSRLRCIARSVVAWIPVFICIPLVRLMAWFGLEFALSSETRLLLETGPAATILVVTYIGGLFYAILHPEAGIHDRICGTRLVPK